MDVEFDGGAAPHAQIAGSAPLPRAAGKVSVLKMRKALRVSIDTSLRALAAKGPFSQEQAVDAMRGVLADVDLNKYKGEFAQRIVAQEVHQRHGQFCKAVQLVAAGQFDMFTEELADSVLLPAEDGMHVSLARAKWSHIMFKLNEQELNANRAAATLALTREVFEPHRKAMEPNPTLEFRDVMYRLGYWGSSAAA